MWINCLPDPLTLVTFLKLPSADNIIYLIGNILTDHSIVTLLTQFKQQTIISPNILIAISVYLQDTVK